MIMDLLINPLNLDDRIKSGEYSLIGQAEDLVLNGYQLWNNLYAQRKIVSTYKKGIALANPLIEQIVILPDLVWLIKQLF